MYLAWIFALPLSLFVSVAITVLLSKLHFLENGEFGFIAAIGIVVIVGYAAPFVFLSIWGYLSRLETPKRVLTEGVIAILLQLLVFVACAPLLGVAQFSGLVNFFWGALFGLGLPQLFCLGGVIVLHIWHRPIKHIIMWAALLGVIIAVFVITMSIITLQLALVTKVICSMQFLPLDWLKAFSCPVL